jgi:tetratricopeptide (TPR) repeat protein
MSVALVEHLLVGQANVPAVLVVTTRLEDGPLDQLLAEAGGTGRVTWLPLERLDARAMTTLLREAVDDEAADRVHRASGGNPLYALQVAKLVDDPDWASGPLPEDLDRLCRARLDTLPRDVAQLVRAAAVLGDEFDGVALAQLLDESRVAISARISRAVMAGLVNPDSGADRFRFAHGIMRQAADGQLDPSTRAHLHAAAARHLGGDPVGRRSEIAHHLFEARRLVAGEEVGAALVLAGSEALALGDADAARRCYQLVMEVVELGTPQRAAASLGLGLASAIDGDFLESTSYLDDTLDAARSLGRWDLVADAVIARTQFGLAASIPAAIEEVRVLDEVLGHLDAVERERRCLLLCWKFDLLANTSAVVAGAALDEAARLAADLDDPRLERLVAFGRLRQSDAACEPPADRLDDAAALVTRAEQAGDAALAGRAGLLLQGFRLRSGEADAAVADHERLRALASDPGTALQYDIAEVGLATATEPIEAIDRASSKALDHLLSDRASLPTVVRMIHLMAIRREQRRLGELEPFLVMALAMGPRRITRPLVAACRLEAGDRRGADEELRTFVAELEAMEVDWTFLATLAFAAESAAEGGYTPLASPLQQRLAAAPPQVVVACSVLLSLGHIDRYLGLALALQGDLDQAIDRFANARGHDRASGAALWAAWAAHGEAEARLRRAADGDERTALALLVGAEQTARTHESPRLLQAVTRVRPTAP